jgi:uncharacterized membrane protein YphA (DoxX/SURF4 family)
MKKILSSKLFRIIWSIGLAALFYFICPLCFSKTTLSIILLILLVLINGAEFIARSPWPTHIARFLVGGLFIFSGFIKANDPLGFSYKLEEYFEVFKGDTGLAMFDWFAHIALPLAIIICVSEMILGVMLLIGFKRNLTLWLLFAQIAFFTFLTFYSACYNKVTHCGCFGDFLKLKPWESFWKDIALLILITLLFAGKEHINELVFPFLLRSIFFIALVASIWFPIHAYRNLPPLDFRAYAPGMNIKDNMKTAPDYSPAVYESGFIYENLKTGEKKEFTMKNYPWQDTLNWKWSTTSNILIKDAYNPPKITDFTVNNLDGVNITNIILNNKGYSFLIICYDLTKTETDPSLHAKLNDLYTLAERDGQTVWAMTSSGAKEIDEYKHAHNALYDFTLVDGIVLKTMIRSNPGLILMKDGTIIANWAWRNIPSYSEIKEKYMK